LEKRLGSRKELNLELSKEEILFKAQQNGIKKVFKSTLEECYSLTDEGFEYCKRNYKTFTLQAEIIKSKDIIMANKVLKSPFYLNNKKNEIYHFDEMIHIQSVFYKKDLSLFLESLA
jgi:hypothetical protein